MGAICNCGTQLGIPTGTGPGPWTQVRCVGGNLVVPQADSPDVCQPAGTWGGGGLIYPGGEGNGAPVYCSTTGLRTAPPHNGVVRNRVGLGSAPLVNGSPVGAGSEHQSAEANVVIANPSASRNMNLLVLINIGLSMVSPTGVTDANFGVNVYSGFSFSGRFQQWRGNPSANPAAVGQVAMLSDIVTIGPSASVTFAGKAYMTVFAGTALTSTVALECGISVWGYTV